jgi:Polyketide cyclase / dehydrase and lipid transport
MTDSRRVEVMAQFDIPADFLWRTLSDFEHIDRWSNLKVRSIEGSGIGCLRTVEMESGVRVTERLLLCDHERRVVSYEVLAPNPYPMLDYRATVTIEATSVERSRLHWVGSYVPTAGLDPAKTDKLLHGVYNGGIELLRQHFARS